MNRIKIVSDGTPAKTVVLLDGKALENLVRLQIDVEVAQPLMATVTMRCYVSEIDIEGFAHVEPVTRTHARMSDLEAIERAMLLAGTVSADACLKYISNVLALAWQELYAKSKAGG